MVTVNKPALLLTLGLIGAVTACESSQDETVGEGIDYPEQESPDPQQQEQAVLQPTGDGIETHDGIETDDGIEKVAGREQPASDSEERQESAELVQHATNALRQMKADEGLEKLLGRAEGLFIVPQYGRAAVVVGGSGGQGVVLARQGEKWSGPAFYDIGGISIGAQVGAEGGQIAMLLMSKPALAHFKDGNTFSLNADAKLTLVDYSKMAGASADKAGDVVFWSDTKGAFGGAALGATNIAFDEEETHAYYGKEVDAREVLDGQITGPRGALEQELTGL